MVQEAASEIRTMDHDCKLIAWSVSTGLYIYTVLASSLKLLYFQILHKCKKIRLNKKILITKFLLLQQFQFSIIDKWFVAL